MPSCRGYPGPGNRACTKSSSHDTCKFQRSKREYTTSKMKQRNVLVKNAIASTIDVIPPVETIVKHSLSNQRRIPLQFLFAQPFPSPSTKIPNSLLS